RPRVGHGMEQRHDAKAEDRRTVGADAVLHDRGLVALDPAEDGGDVEDEEHHECDASEGDAEIGQRGHHADAVTRRPGGSGAVVGDAFASMAPSDPIDWYVSDANAGTAFASSRNQSSARPRGAGPPSMDRRRPNRSQPASASPSGSTAARKRWTRPRKLVKVPSRSTQAASGSTSGARALVPLSLVPVKMTVPTRPSASVTSRAAQPHAVRSCWITQSTLRPPARARARIGAASASSPIA